MAPPSQAIEVSASDVLQTAGWSAMDIVMVSVFGTVAFVLLLASVVGIIKSRRRVNEMAANLDHVTAELGVQRGRASSLQRTLDIRDAFIELNFANGPEAQLAAAFGTAPKQGRDFHRGEIDNDPFVVGSDDESSDDDEESEWSMSVNKDGESPRSPTPVAAVRIRPSEIKMVTLQLRRIPTQDVDLARLGTTVAEGGQPRRDDKGPLEADLQETVKTVKKEGTVKDQYPCDVAQGVFSHPQVDRYWMDNTIETPTDAPSVAKGTQSTEAETRSAEVDQGNSFAKDVGSMQVSIVSSSSGYHDAPDTPESKTSPLPSVPSSPVVPFSREVSPLDLVVVKGEQ